MKAGISTASLFLKKNNEDVFSLFNDFKVDSTEVFFTSFCEYEPSFARLLVEQNKGVEVNSVHTLTTQFEPQLYAAHPKVISDAYDFLEKVMMSAQILGAKYYTFHGLARIKRSSAYDNYKMYGERTKEIFDFCRKFGVTLSYENVEWSLYNKPGIFKILKEYCPELKGVLDIKQARISSYDYREYLAEMGEDISHVHISDIDERGKMCLPGRGCFDFDELIKRLSDVGFDGCILIEAYNGDFKDVEELIASYNYIKERIYKFSEKK